MLNQDVAEEPGNDDSDIIVSEDDDSNMDYDPSNDDAGIDGNPKEGMLATGVASTGVPAAGLPDVATEMDLK
jgi:hypothetical protein